MKVLFEVVHNVYVPGIIDEHVSYDGICHISISNKDLSKATNKIVYGDTYTVFVLRVDYLSELKIDNKWSRKRYCPMFLQDI